MIKVTIKKKEINEAGDLSHLTPHIALWAAFKPDVALTVLAVMGGYAVKDAVSYVGKKIDRALDRAERKYNAEEARRLEAEEQKVNNLKNLVNKKFLNLLKNRRQARDLLFKYNEALEKDKKQDADKKVIDARMSVWYRSQMGEGPYYDPFPSHVLKVLHGDDGIIEQLKKRFPEDFKRFQEEAAATINARIK